DVRDAAADVPKDVAIKSSATCRLVVKQGPSPRIIFDGIEHAVPGNMADFLQALIDANGRPVSMTEHKVRSRDRKKLPKELVKIIHRKPGGGTSIRPEDLWLS